MKEKIQELYKMIEGYIPSFFKNFYVIVSLTFIVWMLSFDANNLFIQIKQTNKYNELLSQKKYYQEKIFQVKEDMKDLQGNQELLEKFAREKYYFQKANEDVYVVVEEELKQED